MTFRPDFTTGNYVPEQVDLPSTKDLDQFREELKAILEDHARLLNRKDTGQYEEREVQVNQTYPGNTPQEKRYIFRKVINVGILATGLNNIAHGIVTGGAGSTYQFKISRGQIWDQTLPLWVEVPNDNIHIDVDGTNVNITIPALYNGFTGEVVLEFSKN